LHNVQVKTSNPRYLSEVTN